jgi:hypothetical protein
MASPRRRPLTRANLDVEDTLRRALKQAPEIELGWSALKQEMREAGWPARTPEGDMKPSVNPPESSSIDYGDPTGDMAMRLDSLADDLDALQDHWHLVATSLRAMAVIAAKHRPPAVPAVPACSVTQCDQAVEAFMTEKHGVSYRGMEQIAGYWIAKVGCTPTCARHRKQRERAA